MLLFFIYKKKKVWNCFIVNFLYIFLFFIVSFLRFYSECVALQDPYCAWDKIAGKCRSHGAPRWLEENYYYQNVTTGQHAACPSGWFWNTYKKLLLSLLLPTGIKFGLGWKVDWLLLWSCIYRWDYQPYFYFFVHLFWWEKTFCFVVI